MTMLSTVIAVVTARITASSTSGRKGLRGTEWIPVDVKAVEVTEPAASKNRSR